MAALGLEVYSSINRNDYQKQKSNVSGSKVAASNIKLTPSPTYVR
jgi:hypothetical protein